MDPVPANKDAITAMHPRRLAPALIVSGSFLLLIALAIWTARKDIAVLMIGAVMLEVAGFHRLLGARRFFALALANLTGIYACIFLFFIETNFAASDPAAVWVGFLAPLAAFFVGAMSRRAAIRRIVTSEVLRDQRDPMRIVLWLLPVFAVGAFSFLLPADIKPQNADAALLGAMAAISAVVLGVSDEVAIFLIDSALLFEEFFGRIARLAVPAFAFLTIYALLIITFGAIYALVDATSAVPQFRVDGALHAIGFAESLYFSLTTLSSVGYGDITPATSLTRVLAAVEIISGLLMLLFGVNEILNYSRDRRRHPPEG